MILVELAEQTGRTGSQLAEAVAVELARGFADGAFTHDFCNDLAMEIEGWLLDLDEWGSSDVFRRVYDAFDAGEYRHRGDPDDVDPVDKYTRPYILAVLREL